MSRSSCEATASASTCDRCVVSECTFECSDCKSDPGCPSALQCALDCGQSTSCIQSCGSEASLQRVLAYVNCVSDSCVSACGGGSSAPAASSCEGCVSARCSDIAEACSQDQSCVNLVNCCNRSESQCQSCIDAAPDWSYETLVDYGDCVTACGCDDGA